MTYCDNRALREEMYRAYSTRASDQGPNAGKWDNSPVMAEILACVTSWRSCWALTAMRINPSPPKWRRIRSRCSTSSPTGKTRPSAGRKELAQLRAFAKAEFGVDELQPWDIAYYSEKQKQHLYSISDEQLRPLFPGKQSR